MNLIVVVDDNMGMTFNKRRQSQDKVLREKIIQLVGENNLYVNTYTRKQFKEQHDCLKVSETPMRIQSDSDYCFIENLDVTRYEETFNKIIVYYWNRVYPRDLKFNINLDNWECISEQSFKGNSHDEITEKIYIRKETINE